MVHHLDIGERFSISNPTAHKNGPFNKWFRFVRESGSGL
ncbi:unnamed protein product [Linum tenue]|uniref:Uncharacterized protein n=1 Tax=Linum tenue TaxID=586396 RepID=A0AAV0NWM1_9ROSI|nr:unnamed protein product [Linum tenue]